MIDASGVLRQGLLQLSRSTELRSLIERAPVSRSVVQRFVAGSTTADAVRASQAVCDSGRLATIDYLGEDTLDLDQAKATRDAYLTLLAALGAAGLTQGGLAEVSVKLSAVGQLLSTDGHKIALDHAREICQAAVNAGTTVTLDAEDHTTTDGTLETLRELRQDYPTTGAVLQAYLRRTEDDCRALAHEGSRVRLCKGAYDEPESVAFQAKLDVDRSYVRCLNILMAGEGRPMVATHDPTMVAIAEDRAKWFDRSPDSFEFQMLYGIRPDEQRRLLADGYTMRVYLPYGVQWYGYLMRRLAERPANLAFFLRSLGSRG